MLVPTLRVPGVPPRLLAIAAIGLLSVSDRTQADDKVQTLLKERLAVLQEIVRRAKSGYDSGGVDLAELIKARQAANRAELDLCETNAERIIVREKMLAEAKQNEELFERRFQASQAHTSDVLNARAKRLKIEIALERLRGN